MLVLPLASQHSPLKISKLVLQVSLILGEIDLQRSRYEYEKSPADFTSAGHFLRGEQYHLGGGVPGITTGVGCCLGVLVGAG